MTVRGTETPRSLKTMTVARPGTSVWNHHAPLVTRVLLKTRSPRRVRNATLLPSDNTSLPGERLVLGRTPTSFFTFSNCVRSSV